MKMHSFPSRSFTLACLWGILTCLILGILLCPVNAADESIEAYLGETLTLHGISYSSDRVYLFMTGPGLSENGVTLTNVYSRADQGHFTQVDVDSSQQWTLRWDTSKLEPDIDPGTYLVYVTTEPADKAHLGGTSTYKTLEVYFKDSGKSKVSVSSGTSYTLNPEMHTSRYIPQLNLAAPSPVPAPSTLSPTPVTSLTQSPPSLSLPTTKAPLLSTTLVAGIMCAGCLILLRRKP
jgi:hypothetical protein